ncbi:proton myo-inositol cotransporter-like [Diachasmimorpha longicaudata]|uniref:proton myo-inositol cotransporter-like n=1 Tax=Diachasmimorpha longicaudata TaxID=58733 RepID=UPI0030B8D8CA
MEIEEARYNVNKNAGKTRQLIATVMANMYTFMAVVLLATLVSTYDQLGLILRPQNNISFQVVAPFSMLLGFPIARFSCELYGRKFTLCIAAIPLTLCCVLLSVVENTLVLLTIAFALGGVGSALCLFTVPIYVAEISCDGIRGGLGTVRAIFMTIGLASAYLITYKRAFRDSAYIVMFFPLFLGLGFAFMPETPIYLYGTSGIEDTTKSLMQLRGNNQACVTYELSRMRENGQMMVSSKSYCFGKFFKDPGKRRGFIAACGLLCGQSVWQVITALHIWMHMHGLITADKVRVIPVIIFLTCQILGSIASSILMRWGGRRQLLFVSCIGTIIYFVAYVTIALLPYNLHASVWILIPLAILSIIAYYAGIGTLPSVIATEVFPRAVLSLGYMWSVTISWIVLFLLVGLTSLIDIPAYTAALINVGLCICYFVFIVAFVPETKGSNIEEIARGLRSGYKQ